jgi:hypothetical protein
MKAYWKDLRLKLVDAVDRRMTRQGVAPTREAPQVRGAARKRVNRHARARLGHPARDRRGGAGESGRGLPSPRQGEAPLRARRDALLRRVRPAHDGLQHRQRLPLLRLPEAPEVGPRAKRALVGAFGTGLKLGLTWMPPQLRREIYGALGLRVSVRPDGDMYAEARVDAAVVRFSCEVERYAEALMDAERRIEAAGPEGKAAGLDRAERELARVRRELSSGGADTVMAEVVS